MILEKRKYNVSKVIRKSMGSSEMQKKYLTETFSVFEQPLTQNPTDQDSQLS